MKDYKVKYIKDVDVDDELNQKLIDALTTCFPDQPVFKKQRYYKELPQHRWFIEDGNKVIAHTALHEKIITTEIRDIRIVGIAEVLVHPDYRRQGLAKMVLDAAHRWGKKHGFEFSLLFFGEENVYKSSGYKLINNPIKYVDYKTNEEKVDTSPIIMVKALTEKTWPNGLIDLNGPTF